jgi:hypothetical protein
VPSNHTLVDTIVGARAGAGIEAVGVDLVEAESLVPVITLTCVQSDTRASFSFSKSVTVSPLLPIC